jgi:hypothetical protein
MFRASCGLQTCKKTISGCVVQRQYFGFLDVVDALKRYVVVPLYLRLGRLGRHRSLGRRLRLLLALGAVSVPLGEVNGLGLRRKLPFFSNQPLYLPRLCANTI